MGLKTASMELRRDPLVWISSGLLALLALVYLVPLLGQKVLEGLGWYGTDPILLSLVLLAIQLGLSRSGSAGERLFWSYVTVAFAFWLIAAVYTALLPLLRLPGWIGPAVLSDCLYLGYYLALLLTTEVDPESRSPQWTNDPDKRLNAWGGVLFAVALLAYFVLIPSRLDPAEYGTWRPSMLLYLGLETLVSLRFGQLALRARSVKWRWIFGLLLGASLISLALLGLEYRALFPGSPIPDRYGTPWDLFWCLPFLPVLLAARLQHRLPAATSPVNASLPKMPRTFGPLVFYAVAFPLFHQLLTGSGGGDAATKNARHVLVIAYFLLVGGLALLQARRLKRWRLEAERMERLAGLGELSAMIAHEIRNPLTVLVLGCHHLATHAEMPKEFHDTLDDIQLAVDQLQAITTEILDFSKPENVSLTREDLVRIAEAALRATHRQLERSGVRVSRQFQHRSSTVLVDVEKMAHLFTNLFDNARRAMPEGGELVLHTANGPQSLELVIEDSGCGIEAANLEKIFQPFFTTRRGGIGLGLAMVARILAQHGWHHEIESQPGRGTKFKITAPLAPALDGEGLR